MSTALKVCVREHVGSKGFARALRREGFVPAIIYGGQEAPQAVSVCAKALDKKMDEPSFRNHVHVLDIDGKHSQKVLVRDITFHPVKDTPSHVDFFRLSQGAHIVLTVPLVFEGEDQCPGIKRGGILNIVHQALEVSVPAEAIPEKFVISLKDRALGDAIHLEDINIPSSVKVLRLQPKTTLANIVAPAAEKDESEAEESEEATRE